MNAHRVNAAAGVILAAQKQKNTAAGIAASLEAAGLLQSPESAAELVALRDRVDEVERAYIFDTAALKKRVAELEAAAAAVRGQHYEVDGTFDGAGSCIQCGSNYPCATVQALSTEAPDPTPSPGELAEQRHLIDPLDHVWEHLADEDPAAAAVSSSIAAQFPLLAALRAEDPHDSPLHHTYAVPRDLPAVSS